jgi:hypothetical protein
MDTSLYLNEVSRRVNVNDVLPNPYTPGQLPRVLAGRGAEVATIRTYLARTVAYGELGGPLLVFHAPRGVGKTSLLREGQREAEEQGFVTAWVSCVQRRPFLPEVVDRVGHALARTDVVRGREQQRWQARMEKVSLELGPPGVKVSASLSQRQAAPPAPAPVAAVEDLLHEAATAVRNRFGAGLVLFLDELHAAGRADAAVLLNALQNLDGARADNPLVVIGAGLPSTPEELTRAATFGERSSFVALPLLDDRAAREALVAPARLLDVTWSPGAVWAVESTARGYPYFLQLLAHAAWEEAAPEAGGQVEADHVVAGMPRARSQLEAMYRARWRSATDLEQQFMSAMAHELGADAPTAPGEEDGDVSRAAVAARMGRPSRSISMVRERLLDKGVVEATGHGRLRFTLPGFAAYVRTQSPD